MLSRPRPLCTPLLGVLACLAAGVVAGASEYRETEDFADAVAAVERYADRYGSGQTLLVVDIDNTLLAMRGDLGSDQWFEWQEYLLEHEPGSPDLVAEDFGGLLEAQGLLFTLGQMSPPQADQPELIKRVQSVGVPTVVLTSRGPDFRPATERELAAAGYDFAASAAPLAEMPAGPFLPYDPAAFDKVGLTAEEARLYNLKSPRSASWGAGVLMTSGQHKGAMLLVALQHLAEPPQAIVFVDDHGRHVHRVYDALCRRGIENTVFHYRREDDRVARFRYSDKSEVTRKWRRLNGALQEVFTLPMKKAVPSQAAPVALPVGATKPAIEGYVPSRAAQATVPAMVGD